MSVLSANEVSEFDRADSVEPVAVRIETLGAGSLGEWDRFVHSADGTLFHSGAWLESVREAFGHQTTYLAARRGRRLTAVLPLVEVRSLLGGRMLVSVPYGVYGGAIGDDDEAVDGLFCEALRIAGDIGARSVEMRSVRARWSGVPVVDRYLTFRKRLPDRAEDCLGSLPRKARAAVRAARDKHKLEVSFDDTHLRQVWRLYCAGMRRLGSLNYPFRFLESLIQRTPERHLVSLIRHEGRPIGGLVTFLFNGTALPYFVGVDASSLYMNVYNLLYLTAMERAVELGCHTFDFGRSRKDNLGACAFKRNQGFVAQPLGYQVHVPAGQTAPNLTPSNPKFALPRRLWPMLPEFVTRPMGAWLSRHIPG